MSSQRVALVAGRVVDQHGDPAEVVLGLRDRRPAARRCRRDRPRRRAGCGAGRAPCSARSFRPPWSGLMSRKATLRPCLDELFDEAGADAVGATGDEHGAIDERRVGRVVGGRCCGRVGHRRPVNRFGVVHRKLWFGSLGSEVVQLGRIVDEHSPPELSGRQPTIAQCDQFGRGRWGGLPRMGPVARPQQTVG